MKNILTPRHLSYRKNLQKALFLLFFIPTYLNGWGFFAHKEINEKAIFLLPTELLSFYKKHLSFIKEEAVKPDKRRYIVEGEARYHFINIENYERLAPLPTYWNEATQRYEEDFMNQYGILPWHIMRMTQRLTKAFEEKNLPLILRLSADLGHYIADAHVPLHTTENYNGQLTNQHGIHPLWESRLPELFATSYNFLFKEKAIYIENLQLTIWEIIRTSHKKASQVLSIEKELDKKFPATEKYVFEQRGASIRRTYTRGYSTAYHEALGGMVETQMRASIKMVSSIWLTCWIKAGCPDLSNLDSLPVSNTIEELPNELLSLHVRPHE